MNSNWASRADTARLARDSSSLSKSSQGRKSEDLETHCEFGIEIVLVVGKNVVVVSVREFD